MKHIESNYEFKPRKKRSQMTQDEVIEEAKEKLASAARRERREERKAALVASPLLKAPWILQNFDLRDGELFLKDGADATAEKFPVETMRGRRFKIGIRGREIYEKQAINFILRHEKVLAKERGGE